MIVSLAYLIIAVSYCFGVDMSIMSNIAGMSLVPLLFMYVSSYVFGFCAYHRMFLHYIAVNDVVNIYDLYIGMGTICKDLFTFTISIVGISLFIILYMYVKSHKRVTAKSS